MKLKKILALVLCVAMVFSTMSFTVSAETTKLNGAGTETDPFMINSVEDLLFFRDSVNAGETDYNAADKWVALGADIDLKGAAWTEGIGDGHNFSFDGNFDGNGYSIRNLVVEPYADSENPETAYICGGLFGYIYGEVTIQDLVLENVTVATAEAGHNVGALVGFANNKGGKANISNITVTGEVVIDAPNAYGVGAIVGYSYRDMGTIANCVVDADNGSYITGYSYVGGITGYSYSNAVIANCSVNNIDITGTGYSVGGIIGLANPGVTVEGCDVADVKVDGLANVGAVLGALAGPDIVVEDCTTDLDAPLVGGSYENNAPTVASVNDTYYTTLEEALENFEAGDTLTLWADATIEATRSSGYGKAAIVLDGGMIDGNGYKLTVTGANNTWDCAINVKGGTIKDITVAGAMRGVFTGGTNADVILDNVTFENVIYTFNSDAGNKNFDIIIKNSVVNGWTSFSNAHKLVTFENCSFGEGSGYAYMRPYNNVQYIGCDFATGYEIDPRAEAEFEDCTVDGESMTGKDLSAIIVGGDEIVATANGFKVVANATDKADSISVVYELASEIEGEKVYNIVLRANDGDKINELASADLTFVYTTAPVKGGAINFTVAPATKFAMVDAGENRYEFNYNGVDAFEGTNDAIVIGAITVTGYGKYTIATADVDTNVVNATTLYDNLVDTYTVEGATDDDATTGGLDISGKVAGDDAVIAVPTRELKITIDFPNAVTDQIKAYQDMKVEITGVFDGETKTVPYVLGGNMVNGSYVLEDIALVRDNAYTVTVSGAGYRTARYTVTMTEDKALRFWNNVMDEAQFVEIGKESSKVEVTFLAGDIVKDNNINIYDLSAVVSYFGTQTVENGNILEAKYAKYDLNRDGVIDSKDVAYVLVSWNN